MKKLAFLAAIIFTLLLTACGGGGGGGSSAATNYYVSVNTSGLQNGQQVTLLINGANPMVVNSNGTSAFPTAIVENGSYVITVGTQPTYEVCTVNNGSGTGVTSNVNNVTVTCSLDTYTISGTVAGLTSGLQTIIQNNSSNSTTITNNGTFVFSVPVSYGGSYAVTVGTQPIGQTCTVTNGSGSSVSSNISGIVISCSVNTYSISGVVTGLNSGQQVTLNNNSANGTIINSNGNFTFSTPIVYGSGYSVSVGTQPNSETCTVQNGSGNNTTSNINNVSVTCGLPASLMIVNGVNTSLTSSALTFYGNAALQNETDPWGNSNPVISINGSSNGYSYATVPFSTALGTQDFTIDFWFYPTLNNNTSQALLSDWNNVNGPFVAMLSGTYMNTNFSLSGGVRSVESNSGHGVVFNAWNHYAITRNSGVFNYWVNGALDYSDSAHVGISINPADGTLYIGHQEGNDAYAPYTGYITEIRVVPGKALYSSAFTPPASIATYTKVY
jgi:hypothetical protein